MDSSTERVIISPPVHVEPSAEEYEQVRECIDLWHKMPGSALILPMGWTFEVVRADMPTVIERSTPDSYVMPRAD